MRDRVDILGILVDKVNKLEAIKRIERFTQSSTANMIVTPNAEMIIRAYRDKKLRRIINSADLIIPDGAGVVLAARLLGSNLEERVAGIDLVRELLARGEEKNYRFYFLGAAPGIANQAKIRVKEKFPKLFIKTHHGYLDRTLEEKVFRDIKENKIDILLVGMGVPLQERWLARYLTRLEVSVGIGVGGTFDILSGNKRRAPQLIQDLNLEWLYRLAQEPQRLGRVGALPKFIYKVFQQKLNKLK